MTGADDMDGMDRLSIKADRSGIVVYVPAAMSVNDICCDLYCRILDNISAFQKKGTVCISFRGCTLERGDTEEIISFLSLVLILMLLAAFLAKRADIFTAFINSPKPTSTLIFDWVGII